MRNPFEGDGDSGPHIGRRPLVLVDGRTFAISEETGEMTAPSHGLVHDDRRHLSHFTVAVERADIEVLASSAPTPLSAVIVGQVGRQADGLERAVLTRRRWVASGLREDLHVHNTTPRSQQWTLQVRLAADFAHVFDVKAGVSAAAWTLVEDADGWTISPGPDASVGSLVRVSPAPDDVDTGSGVLAWRLAVAARGEATVTVTVEPVVDGVAAGLAFPCGIAPSDAIPMRRLASWRESVPRVVSTDPRLALAVDQALADIAALRIIDADHLDRAVVAAGAPWFMTLFGRDSLLTSWMTLPFEPSLARGVLSTLADLQGRAYDPVAEEQPGKILHELRRRGGGGPFSTRNRYYGTVDATPLFVMLAAEAWRWGALSGEDLGRLAPAVDAALTWILGDGDSNGDGLIDYRRSDRSGLANQGWKDSWNGITFADGSLPEGPIALVEVQGYVYAALLGAAELVVAMGLERDAGELLGRARRLKERFNESFWDQRGWFVVGLDGQGRRIDSLTTNPGHALWTGIADADLAGTYLDRLAEPAMWTGWGLRTLAETMAAYDPLSYHNGSVWPHDTALCTAGAARYGRWDLVDQLVDGALDAASEFEGRPPELFAGISRADAPMPVAYPSSCSPQAWSSASILMLIRTALDLAPTPDRSALRIGRAELSGLPELALERIVFGGGAVTIRVDGGVGSIVGAHR
jgi:glycogen debranching enzyme